MKSDKFFYQIVRKIVQDIRGMRFAIGILLCYGIVTQLAFGTVCPFRIALKFPCPACGLTHAGISVLLFQWKQAWEYHPMIFFWMAMIIWAFVQRYFVDYVKWLKAGGGEKFRAPKHPAFQLCMFFCCLATVGYYVCRICLKFV